MREQIFSYAAQQQNNQILLYLFQTEFNQLKDMLSSDLENIELMQHTFNNQMQHTFNNQVQNRINRYKISYLMSPHSSYFYPNADKTKKQNLPFINVRYQIKICNNFANLILIQQFYNGTGNQIKDLYYSMPIDPLICIKSLSAKYQNSQVAAQVKELSKALVQYQAALKAVNQNSNVILATLGQKTEGSIQILIGRLPPYQKVEITSHLITELQPYIDQSWILRIPTYIGPRWQEISQQENLHFNFACKWSFDVEIKNTYCIKDHFSVNHPLETVDQQPKRRFLRFNTGKYEPREKDFILTYQQAQWGEIQCSLGKKCLVLTMFQCIENNFKEDIETYIVIDRSGSMQGDRLSLAKEGLKILLDSLPSCHKSKKKQIVVKFNMLHFGNTFTWFCQSPVENNDQEKRKAFQWIDNIKSVGGTKLAKPLLSIQQKIGILQKQEEKLQKRNIVILTDGQIEKIQQIIKIIKNLRENFNTITHIIGIGQSGQSLKAIQDGAMHGGGAHAHIWKFVKDQNRLKKQMVELLYNMMGDSVGKFKIQLPSSVKIQSMFPKYQYLKQMIRKNKVLNIFIRFKEVAGKNIYDIIKKEQIFVQYQNYSKNKSISEAVQFDQLIGCAFERDDCFWKYSAYKEIRELEYEQSQNCKQEIVKKSIEFQVLCHRTAFICKFDNRKPCAGGGEKLVTFILNVGNQMVIQFINYIKAEINLSHGKQIGFFTQNKQMIKGSELFHTILTANEMKENKLKVTISINEGNFIVIKQINNRNLKFAVIIREVERDYKFQQKLKILQKIEKSLNETVSFAIMPEIENESLNAFKAQVLKKQLLSELTTAGNIPYNLRLLEEYNLVENYQINLKKYAKEDAMTLTIYNYLNMQFRGDMDQLRLIIAKMLAFVVVRNQEQVISHQSKTRQFKVRLYEQKPYFIGIGGEKTQFRLHTNAEVNDFIHQSPHWITQQSNKYIKPFTSIIHSRGNMRQKPYKLEWSIDYGDILLIKLNLAKKELQFSIENEEDTKCIKLPAYAQYSKIYPIVMIDNNNGVDIIKGQWGELMTIGTKDQKLYQMLSAIRNKNNRINALMSYSKIKQPQQSSNFIQPTSSLIIKQQSQKMEDLSLFKELVSIDNILLNQQIDSKNNQKQQYSVRR